MNEKQTCQNNQEPVLAQGRVSHRAVCHLSFDAEAELACAGAQLQRPG